MKEFRDYRDYSTARKWMKQLGLDQHVIRYDIGEGRRVIPVILCDTLGQARAIREQRFKAELKHDALRVGATVRLHDSVLKASYGELAVVQEILKDDAIKLDRPIGGTVWWSAKELVVITPGSYG